MQTDRPILAAIPISFSLRETFWSRDMGLTVMGLRKLGVDARLVALGRSQDQPPDLPAILGTREDFGNPGWWRQWQPAGVIFTGWSASRFNDIRRALLAVTPRVIERLDTDGVRSPRVWFSNFVAQSFSQRMETRNPFKKLLAPMLTGLAIARGYWISPRIASAMHLMPALAAESPIAVERIRRLMKLYYSQIPSIQCITHPVAEDYMQLDANSIRQNRIVSVGRWHSWQKNFPLLVKVLEAFLTQHPDWEADIIGLLPSNWNPETWLRHSELRSRLRFHGVKTHREISALYKQSRIFLMTSRYESFNIAAAEALCCGCSVVGPVEIASVPFFTGDASGTVACRQTRDHFLDALGVEVEAWKNGRRNPEVISQKWLATAGATAVAKQFLNCLESLTGCRATRATKC